MITAAPEAAETFACFGSTCGVHVTGAGAGTEPREAVLTVRGLMGAWHTRFTRFDPASELSRLNADPRVEVPVEPLMARFVAAAVEAAKRTGGLVDPTLVRSLEALGYARDLGAPLPLDLALRLAPARAPAAPSAAARWREVSVDRARCTVRRPPGVALDSGGVAKGLFADMLAGLLAGHDAFAVDCGGDLRVGGAAGVAREVRVASPFDGSVLHVFELAHAGIATSGIGRRSWLAGGRAAHHLLDPATGRAAFTGIVQATAIAPTALDAEIRAKAALLSGPAGAAAWLPDGGVLVFDDGALEVIGLPATP